MTVTVGINGFGRIGRCTLAHIAESARNDVEVVKINATGPIETSAHLLRYDSVHGRFPGTITTKGDTMDLGRGPMKVFSTYDPRELDWSGCDVVLECTGKFNDGTKANVHLEQGAKSVLISGNHGVSLILGSLPFELSGTGSYQMDITAGGSTITATGAEGLFYGLISLIGLLDVSNTGRMTLNEMTVYDKPRFDYRGHQVDVARNFVSKQAIENTIDAMAMWKVRRFMVTFHKIVNSPYS